jgi:hypothetical protein
MRHWARISGASVGRRRLGWSTSQGWRRGRAPLDTVLFRTAIPVGTDFN